jgi:diamine N-acetyltransferase
MDIRSRERVKAMIVRQAAQKPEFRAALLRDALAAVKDEFGFEPSPGFAVRAVEETETDLIIVLPPLPPPRDAAVTLREITQENVQFVCNLQVTPAQEGFVAPNARSLAEALVADHAWTRAVYASDVPVGFVMLSDDPDTPKYYLWRFMIDADYQRLGFGHKALEAVIDYVRTRPNAREFLLSYVPGPGSPREFYRRLGFEDTGEVHGGENEMRLAL